MVFIGRELKHISKELIKLKLFFIGFEVKLHFAVFDEFDDDIAL